MRYTTACRVIYVILLVYVNDICEVDMTLFRLPKHFGQRKAEMLRK